MYNKQNIIELYNSGLSAYKISSMVGISKSSVYNYLRNNNIKIRTVSESTRKYNLNHQAFSNIYDKNALYWAGFLMADGCLYIPKIKTKTKNKTTQRRVQLAIHKRDMTHIYKWQKFLHTEMPPRPDKNLFRLDVSSFELFNSLLKFGLTPNKSFTAKANKNVCMSTHFWRGVIDGDGFIVLNKKNYPVLGLVGSKQLMKQFLKFVRSVHPEYRGEVRKMHSIYIIRTSGIIAADLCKLLYTDDNYDYLDRKYKMAHDIINMYKNYDYAHSRIRT